MAKSDVLALAILGTLSERPLHGYQIRKRLGYELGPFHALSYGSLYPCLKRMVTAELIEAADIDDAIRGAGSKRSRISYSITAKGREALTRELASAGAATWDDDAFDVRFSMFAKTDAATRIRILEGRRSRLTERLEHVGENMRRGRERNDAYTTELHRHGLEQVEREVEWLDRLIEQERSANSGQNKAATGGDN